MTKNMTNLEAAAKLVELHAMCETRLSHINRTLSPDFATAVAKACMALRGDEGVLSRTYCDGGSMNDDVE